MKNERVRVLRVHASEHDSTKEIAEFMALVVRLRRRN